MKMMLSDFHPPLMGTPADSPVYLQEGPAKGATVLIVGGTHANEPAGALAAALFLENATVKKGRLMVIPRANLLACLHAAPRSKEPLFFAVDLPSGGKRWFRYGSRYSDPRYAVLAGSGGGPETWEQANLNRCYPGRPQGPLTQQIAYAVMQLIKRESVDLAFDLHEAREKSSLADMAIVHQRALEYAAEVLLELSADGVELRLEASPSKMPGLSHREWGDRTEALAVLLETRNPIQLRYGELYDRFVSQGIARDDKLCGQFEKFFQSEQGKRSLDLRVARHAAAVMAFVKNLKTYSQDRAGRGPAAAKEAIVEGIPSYQDIQKNGLGAYLAETFRRK
jgi:hypothetical protein